MKLVNTVIYVEDVKKTVDFYQRAFSLTLKFLSECGQYAEMNTGDVSLAFVSEAFSKENGLEFNTNRVGKPYPGFEIAFESEDVQAAFDLALKEGAKNIANPTERRWGQTVAYVADINGVLVEICTKCYNCEC